MRVYVMQIHNENNSAYDTNYIYRDFDNLKEAFHIKCKMYENIAEYVKITAEPHIDEELNEAVGRFTAKLKDGTLIMAKLYDYDLLDD